ncbi:Thioredoxin-like 3-3 [Platanthera guangdongensis]|uniref:Thioredoxin-like 3-3 n=1 Tax=Platanthera guangdongensis TaxID=2320717 RepID=A0ABR2M6I8_9ASPA
MKSKPNSKITNLLASGAKSGRTEQRAAEEIERKQCAAWRAAGWRSDQRKRSAIRKCRVCSQILPVFCRLSNEFRKLPFIYADIDECPNATQAIRYTPTFHFYREGEKVDEMFGIGEERLRDRLWLHS